MSRRPNKPTHVRTRVRVSDKDNVITSYGELGRAVGWAKQQVLALNRVLWKDDPGRNHNLPHRTFRYEMPISGVSMIEIKTNPYEGMWEIRIVGESAKIGSFIWIPTDTADGHREQILVKADGLGGPYNVSIKPDLRAGIIDWKGPLRSTAPDGTPFSEPRKDVLSWDGPDNRYGPQHNERSFFWTAGAFIYKDGAKYARAPKQHFDFDGHDDPENDPEITSNADFLRGRVLGAAIQTDEDGNRRDVLVTDDVDLSFGAQGVGFVNWHVFWRPAASGLTTNGVNLPGDPLGKNAPEKWTLIASFPAPGTVNAERWLRSRMWFFNQSGTQASAMVPDNAFGDYTPDPTILPTVRRGGNVNASDPLLMTQNISTEHFPYYLRLVTLDVDAFAETATFTVEGREPGAVAQTNVVDTSSCTGSGVITQFCAGGTGGGVTTVRKESGTITMTGGPWRVAVDYKGDTRVFAEISLLEGSGGAGSSTHTIVAPASSPPVPRQGSYESSSSTIGGYRLRAGALDLVLSESRDISNKTSGSATQTDGSPSGAPPGLENSKPVMNPEGTLLWLDLRTDSALWSVGRSENNVRSSGDGSMVNDALSVTYGTNTGVGTFRSTIQAWQGGTLLTEYRAERVQDVFGVGGFNLLGVSVTFSVETNFDCEQNGGSFRIQSTVNGASCDGFTFGGISEPFVAGPPSLESLARQDDWRDFFEDLGVLNSNVPSTAQTDSAGNVALSFHTPSENRAGDLFSSPVNGKMSMTIPDEPKFVHFITGDDMVSVMNQVTYIEAGPDDELGTPDDVTRPPIDLITGRAEASRDTRKPPLVRWGTIRVL